ncbi:MAG: response regulator, partial [Chloroflexi bacterium]|nr:response regulator [Chloroflexota bacterium]
PPELLSSIFDIFVQADRSLARSEGGLGVGLTLARSLVEQHSGVITVISDGLDRGSEFIVRLPSLTPLRSLAAIGDDAARPQVGGRRIVVVDDNVDALETLADLLLLEGHTVWTAASGPEAIALAGEHDPDVLLVDIGMPGMDGYEVARCILSDPSLRHISMAAVTGYGYETDLRASREAGFRYHLTKPVEIETLREVLRQL